LAVGIREDRGRMAAPQARAVMDYDPFAA
jgi:hypothetical protein